MSAGADEPQHAADHLTVLRAVVSVAVPLSIATLITTVVRPPSGMTPAAGMRARVIPDGDEEQPQPSSRTVTSWEWCTGHLARFSGPLGLIAPRPRPRRGARTGRLRPHGEQLVAGDAPGPTAGGPARASCAGWILPGVPLSAGSVGFLGSVSAAAAGPGVGRCHLAFVPKLSAPR